MDAFNNEKLSNLLIARKPKPQNKKRISNHNNFNLREKFVRATNKPNIVQQLNPHIRIKVNRELTPEITSNSNTSFANESKSFVNNKTQSIVNNLPLPIIYCPNLGLLGSSRRPKTRSYKFQSKSQDDRKSISVLNMTNNRFYAKEQPYKSINGSNQRSMTSNSKYQSLNEDLRTKSSPTPQIMITDESI